TLARLESGLQTVVPTTLELFADADFDPIPAFAAADPMVRRPVGERFATWLANHAPPSVVALATYEAALRHVRADPLTALGEAGTGVVKADGIVVIRAGFDVVAFAEAVEQGAIEARSSEDALRIDEPASTGDAVVITRDRAGQLVIVVVPDEVAACLEDDPADLSDDDRTELFDLEIVRRAAWDLSGSTNELR
ncbi:MAG: hypothetical protein AAF211_29400, partial [Myxococcota bacterium]